MHKLCKGEEHNRYEIVTELVNNQKYRAVGICQECGTKKYYGHLKDEFNFVIVQGHNRDILPAFKAKHERMMHMNHNLVGGA